MVNINITINFGCFQDMRWDIESAHDLHITLTGLGGATLNRLPVCLQCSAMYTLLFLSHVDCRDLRVVYGVFT